MGSRALADRMISLRRMTDPLPTIIGRYAIFQRIAAGGMASVHVGRLLGEAGFVRTVAVKRLHPQFALDPNFVAMFLDEARICARVRHPNVVPTLDVVAKDNELFLVMEYVDGESLSELIASAQERDQAPPVPIVASILSGLLHGLHAAHEAKSDEGEPLGIVHRDVSPHNVLVGIDGVTRVLDFGVAKALGRLHTTQDGALKGKFAYMAPEQILGESVTRRSDVFAASVVLWEALTTKRLFYAENEARRMHMILHEPIRSPRELVPELSPALEQVVMKGLARKSEERYATALDMAEALERAVPLATPRVVGEWLRSLSGERLAERAMRVAEVERFSSSSGVGSPGSSAVPWSETGDDRTVLDPGSRTQASSISVSKPHAGEHDSEGRKRGARLSAVVVGGVLVTLAVYFGIGHQRDAGSPPIAQASSAGTTDALSTENPAEVEGAAVFTELPQPTEPASAMPTAQTSTATFDAAVDEPARRLPTKRTAPRPKKSVYSRE
jgi:eukaryotic-like serine/threonine-protein kinase